MGAGHSLPQIEGFSREEMGRLEKRFQKLDLDRSGSISVKEFLSVPELQENPLVQRVVDVFDQDASGEVDFKGEVMAEVKVKAKFKSSNHVTSIDSVFVRLDQNLVLYVLSLRLSFSEKMRSASLGRTQMGWSNVNLGN